MLSGGARDLTNKCGTQSPGTLARQEAALLLQRQAEADAQSNSSTGGAAAIAGADELARRTADLQRREATLRQIEVELAASAATLDNDGGNASAFAAHPMSRAPTESSRSVSAATSAGGHPIEPGNDVLAALLNSMQAMSSNPGTTSTPAPETLASTTACVATALRKGMMVPLNFDIASGAGKLQAVRRMLEKMTKLPMS